MYSVLCYNFYIPNSGLVDLLVVVLESAHVEKDEICLIFIEHCFILLLFLIKTCLEYFKFVLNQVFKKNIFVKCFETLKVEFYLSPPINTPLVSSA